MQAPKSRKGTFPADPRILPRCVKLPSWRLRNEPRSPKNAGTADENTRWERRRLVCILLLECGLKSLEKKKTKGSAEMMVMGGTKNRPRRFALGGQMKGVVGLFDFEDEGICWGENSWGLFDDSLDGDLEGEGDGWTKS